MIAAVMLQYAKLINMSCALKDNDEIKKLRSILCNEAF